jgi:hypothetical protein
VPVPKNESLYNESSCGGWIEFRDPALDGLLEVWVVVVGMLVDELDDLAITVSSLFVLASSLVHHPQTIVTVVHFRVTRLFPLARARSNGFPRFPLTKLAHGRHVTTTHYCRK